MELITQDDCQELLMALNRANDQILTITSIYKPALDGEHFLTGEDVCRILHISKRTLQEYRDTMLLPYISLFGKMLYKETDIKQLLDENYIKAFKPI